MSSSLARSRDNSPWPDRGFQPIGHHWDRNRERCPHSGTSRPRGPGRDRRVGCDGAARGAVMLPGMWRCCSRTLLAHPVAGCRTASVTITPCTTAVTARRGVRQHAQGVTPTVIHSCATPIRIPADLTRSRPSSKTRSQPGEIAHAAPQVAPGPGDVALVQTPGVGLLLVQEAIGESVLAVEVRGHTDLAEHRASHHGILVVVAEQLRHVLDLLHQPLRRLAEDGRSSLCGIPQPLGCLAGLAPFRVPLVPGREAVGGLHVSGDAAVRPLDQGRQLTPRPAASPTGQWRVSSASFDRSEQRHIPVGVQRSDHPGVPCSCRPCAACPRAGSRSTAW